MRWCSVNFQCRGVLLSWTGVGQGPNALAVGAGGDLFKHFSLVYRFSFFLPLSLWETARYRLKYYLKRPDIESTLSQHCFYVAWPRLLTQWPGEQGILYTTAG